MGRTPPKGVQRSLDLSGSSPPACELPVLRRTNDDLKIMIRPPVCTVVGDSTTSGGAMLRNLTNMESVNEEAGTRARDSALLAARRPGRMHRPGDVSVLGRPQRLLRDGERVCFCTNFAFCQGLGTRTASRQSAIWRRRTHRTRASRTGRRRGLLRSSGGIKKYLHA